MNNPLHIKTDDPQLSRTILSIHQDAPNEKIPLIIVDYIYIYQTFLINLNLKYILLLNEIIIDRNKIIQRDKYS
jgi:hypothetical protein